LKAAFGCVYIPAPRLSVTELDAWMALKSSALLRRRCFGPLWLQQRSLCWNLLSMSSYRLRCCQIGVAHRPSLRFRVVEDSARTVSWLQAKLIWHSPY